MANKKAGKIMTELSRGYHALVWKEGRWYVARGVEIEVASQGKSKLEAVSNLKEALSLLLEDEGEVRIKTPAVHEMELLTLHLPAASYA